MNKYQQQKERARELAIQWQHEASEKSFFWSEIAEYCDYFYKLGKRYGLLKEFRENGII